MRRCTKIMKLGLAVLFTVLACACTTETSATSGSDASVTADAPEAATDGTTTDATQSSDAASSTCLVDSKGVCPNGCGRLDVWTVDPAKNCLIQSLRTIACLPSGTVMSGVGWCYERLDGTDASPSPAIYGITAAGLKAQGWRECDEATRKDMLNLALCT